MIPGPRDFVIVVGIFCLGSPCFGREVLFVTELVDGWLGGCNFPPMHGDFDGAGWGDRISSFPSVLFVSLGFCLTSSCGVTGFGGEVFVLPEDSDCEACLVSGGLRTVRTIGVVVTGDFGVILMRLD